MKLSELPDGQFFVVLGTGQKARVLAHGKMGVLVLAIHRRELPFEGRLLVTTESHSEVWSASAEVDPIGQMILPLDGERKP